MPRDGRSFDIVNVSFGKRDVTWQIKVLFFLWTARKWNEGHFRGHSLNFTVEFSAKNERFTIAFCSVLLRFLVFIFEALINVSLPFHNRLIAISDHL